MSCSFRITAKHVLAELTGDTSQRAEEMRDMLVSVGADRSDFVPAECSKDTLGGSSAGTGGDSGSSAGTGQGQTAADAFGWGEPAKVDDFESDLTGWNMYDGPGNGVRSPDAASVSDGILTINGSGDGTTAGMAWGDAQKYGRWEVRMKAPKGSPSYNALALLWPAAENFPVGGEVDFAEIMDSDRKKVEMFLHYGEDNSQVHGEVEVDATEWHNYAVEWTPDSITTFLDGEEWWKTTDTSILPPGPMHLCLQLDWFPKGDSEAGEVNYDWVKQWPMNESDQASTQSAGSDGSTDSDSSTSLTDEENNWGSQGDSSSDGGDDS
ncbi:hypothetical protein Ae168Ps1_2710c [Pseudonocardia sp. Ae168_Ps1]|nr:hypothetical protein Ae150APs1_2699c [Pseudonocardia sp. Ae150A_Ps1]OLL80304.1 hypothetical protein Ae168Ps1_2710c [Pseudonocardia sp. Ae168_Ps1]OLL85571.1 hypothetical protein Ae263Ps1_2626c [Pseudonocardia sp. Ae263_Ps1]OLL94401.1 hypothetical protein Ae356Ps1_4298c [Pseudonocardia sp. Ae356_Ps1]